MASFKIVGCDNIRESFAAANSTTISLGGAMPNSNSIGSKLSNGDTSWFVVRNGAEFSEGEYTYNTGTPNTLTQTSPYKTSNSNSAVVFSSGTGEVSIDFPTQWADTLNLKEITVLSATTTDIGAVDGGKIVISGTTTITGLGTSTNKLRFVRFSGALTLTHNATSLILPGAANILTVAGDTAIFLSDSSGNWRCQDYQPASGYPLNGVRSKLITITRDLTVASGSVAYTGVGFQPSALIVFAGVGTTAWQYVTFAALADSAKTTNALVGFSASQTPLTNALLGIYNNTTGNNQTATLSSYDADGFTLAWTKTGTPTTTVSVFVLCLR